MHEKIDTEERSAIESARELASRARQHADPVESIVLLARAFHQLDRDADGLNPWDVERLYRWARSSAATPAARHAVRFVISVWNDVALSSLDAEERTPLGPFNAVEAMASWDHAHRAAFETWVGDPWWP